MDEDNNSTLMCANCGKGEECSGDLKSCTACKMVKYCNRDCQIAHRPQHKKACKKRATELHDEALFNEPPPPEDCPICCLPLPFDIIHTMFQSCCGKTICSGCIYAMIQDAAKRGKKREEAGICAFCRAPHANSDEDYLKRIENLTDNAVAFYALAGVYAAGSMGLPQDWVKANELHLKAGELGHVDGYYHLGNAYDDGNGVEVDKGKAKHYWELAAMGGNVHARYNLGYTEAKAGNNRRAMKHVMISARTGHDESLDKVKSGFKNGTVTKDEYEGTLRAYHNSQLETKSDMRDQVTALKSGFWSSIKDECEGALRNQMGNGY